MKKLIGITVVLGAVLGMVGCGNVTGNVTGDDSWLFPLWVETDVTVSDIDADGRPDVVTLAKLSTSESQDEGHLFVYRQTSSGTFASPDDYVVGTYPWKMAVNDVDGDGLPDLVVADTGDRAVWLLLQDSANVGRFLNPRKIASGVYAYDASVADLNSDGVPDIAVTDDARDARRIVLLYQDASRRGTFQPPVDFTLPGNAQYVSASDLTGDGRADLLLWTSESTANYTPVGALAVSVQQSNGTLSPVTTFAPQTGLNAEVLSIANYNGDSRNDLFVFFSPFSSDYHAKLTVLLQDPQSGGFSTPVDTSLEGVNGIDSATFADLNADGRPDVAVVGFFPVGSPSVVKSKLNLFRQSGGGAFARAGEYDMPIAISRVAAGDIDGDGLNDLVVLGEKSDCLVLIQSHNAPGTFNAPRALRQ